jgi:glutathione peroxidase
MKTAQAFQSLLALLTLVWAAGVPAEPKGSTPMNAGSIYDIKVKTIDGRETTLADYRGQALLIVNTASECGFTPQYEGLEKLQQLYKDKGFTVLGFPSNDFGGQEPGTEAQIKSFCETKYKTTFPMFSKVQIKGSAAHPLYKYLTSQPSMTGDVTWNFNKFLVDPTGKLVARFDSKTEPTSIPLKDKVEAVLPSMR